MDDLISRQAAIDAVRSYYDEQYALCDSIEELIEKLPSADTDLSDYSDRLWKNAYERGKAEGERIPSAQPEIIRCKDCVWYGRADKRRFYRGMDCLQKRIDTIVPDRDFCSRAERRTDE